MTIFTVLYISSLDPDKFADPLWHIQHEFARKIHQVSQFAIETYGEVKRSYVPKIWVHM